jgi:glycosyltransferase involved in cell wall biosynthesis
LSSADSPACMSSAAIRRDGTSTVCFPFLGRQVGGSDISALKLINALDRSRFTPLVLIHERDGPTARLFADHGHQIHFPPIRATLRQRGKWAALLHSFSATGALVRFLRQHQVRIVHTNDGLTHATYTVAARLAGARHVWHHRSDPHARGVRFVAPFTADALITVSRFATPSWSLLPIGDRCNIVPSPFDAEWSTIDRSGCRSSALNELGVSEPVLLIGFFGNLVQRKRPLVFLETIGRLKELAPGRAVMGLMFGAPRQYLEPEISRRIQELGLGREIRLMGFRSDPERWLAACDCLLVPAVDEPFGRTLIEAMLLGTPVIAADSGGNREAIRHAQTGLLSEPDDPAAFADGIQRLASSDQLRHSIVEAARTDALGRFGTARHANAVMAIYDRLLRTKDKPAGCLREEAES